MTQTITWVVWVAAIAVAMYAALVRRNNWLILAMMVVLVAASVYWIIPVSTKTKLGLDLQGGLQVVYTAKTATGDQPTSSSSTRPSPSSTSSVNGLGVTESQIQRQGADQISVALPGITNVQEALDKIGKTAQLQFFKDDATPRPVGPVESKAAALKELKRQGASAAEIAALTKEGTTDNYTLVSAPVNTNGNTAEEWYVYDIRAGDEGRRHQERHHRVRPGRQAQRQHRLHRRRQQDVPVDHPRAVPHGPAQAGAADLLPSSTTTCSSRIR